MRLVGSTPDAICVDAELRENLHARAFTTQRPRPAPEGKKEGARNAKQITKYAARVIDDWPDVVPVTLQELDVIEIYLRAVVDGFLGTTE
jgi:hypothetical protein